MDEVARLLLLEDDAKLSVIKEVAPLDQGAPDKEEFITRWRGPLERAYEDKKRKPVVGKLLGNLKIPVH